MARNQRAVFMFNRLQKWEKTIRLLFVRGVIMYDVIGAGIGPFNLGLAALLEDIPGTDALFR